MREILFRGKRMDDGEWVEGYLVKAVGGECMILPVTAEHCGGAEFSEGYHCDPTTVGQYTGLKDKNGKMIFDGDILLLDDIKGIVNYGTGCFCVNLSGQDYLYRSNPAIDIVLNGYPGLEIIGNIHDNPEMLKGGEG